MKFLVLSFFLLQVTAAMAADFEASVNEAPEAEPVKPTMERVEPAVTESQPNSAQAPKYPREYPKGHQMYWLLDTRGAFMDCEKELEKQYNAVMKVEKIILESEEFNRDMKTSKFTVKGELVTGKLVTGRFTLDLEQKWQTGQGPKGYKCSVVESHAPMAEKPKKKGFW